MDANLLCKRASMWIVSVIPTSRTMKSILYSQLSILLMSGIYAEATSTLPRLLNHGAMPIGMEQGCLGTSILQTVSGKSHLVSGLSILEVPVGKSELVFKFSEATQFRTITFAQSGLEGVVHAFASLDGIRWDLITTSKLTKADLDVNLDKISRYGSLLKLEFNVSQAGKMVTPAIATTHHDSDFQVKQTTEARQWVNFATGLGGARVIYSTATTHPSGVATGLVNFDATQRKDNYLVYDLNESRKLDQISFVGADGFESVEIYSGMELPENEDWKGRLSLSTEGIPTMTCIAKAGTSEQPYLHSLKDSVEARYVVLKLKASPEAELARLVGLSIAGKASVSRVFKGGSQFVHSGMMHSKIHDLDQASTDEADNNGSFKKAPAVFAWDLERNMNSNLVAGANGQPGAWMNGSILSTTTRGRRADGEPDPDPDPLALEILRCDFVSEP